MLRIRTCNDRMRRFLYSKHVPHRTPCSSEEFGSLFATMQRILAGFRILKTMTFDRWNG